MKSQSINFGGARPKAVVYARVSSKDQEKEGFSLPAQLKLLKEYADAKGFDIVEEFVETETAKRAGRTQFARMLKFLKSETKKKNSATICRTILVEKTDRLYRNVLDYGTIDGEKFGVHFVKENVILEPNSSSNDKFMHGIKVLMAKNYVENLSEEIGKGMKEKASQGYYPSYAPIGYMNVVAGDKKLIVPDPQSADHVRKMFQKYATGSYSLLTIQREMVAAGFRSRRTGAEISRSAIATLLGNPMYYGEFVWNEKMYRGNYEALISKELFEQVQSVLNKKATTKTGPRKYSWAFQGLLSCGHCGCAIVADIKKGKYIYYRCTGYKGKCPEKAVREEVLTAKFEKIMESIQLGPKEFDLVIRALKESQVDEQAFHFNVVTNLQKEKEGLERRIDSLYTDKLDGVVSLEFYQQKNQAWQADLKEVQKKLEKHGVAHFAYMEEGVQLLTLAREAVEKYRKFEQVEKRRIINLVLSNSIWMNADLTPKFRQPFELLALAKAEADAKGGEKPFESAEMSEWYTRQESNL